MGSNWFFNGHRNKLTLDVSYLETDDTLGDNSVTRLQFQWDVSF